MQIGPFIGPAIGPGIGTFGSRMPLTTQTVTVTDSADPVITGGDAFSYTVQYTVTGSSVAINVSVVVTLDASLSYVSASGTGWTINRVGQVVTCTRSSAAVGAAPAITINVTTGGSATTASTSAAATATNAPNANGSQNTTVQLVSQDATSLIYVPASSTEWTNFIARKVLTNWSNPTNLYLCQEASSPTVDQIGGVNLAQGGAGPTFQTAMTGWTRKMIQFHDAGANDNIAGVFANANANSLFALMIVDFQSTTNTHQMLSYGNATLMGLRVSTTPRLLVAGSPGTIGTGTVSPVGRHVFTCRLNRATSGRDALTDQEKIIGTAGNTQSGTSIIVGGFTSGLTLPPNFGVAYIAFWVGATAERSDAEVKSLLQALGYTISWT